MVENAILRRGGIVPTSMIVGMATVSIIKRRIYVEAVIDNKTVTATGFKESVRIVAEANHWREDYANQVLSATLKKLKEIYYG